MKSFKNKRGIATVLGMLIFVGILFTAVIPLFMYVNEANLYLYQTRMELQKIDEDKERENIDVYAYPPDPEAQDIVFCVKNTSPLNVEIVRVWVNDECYNVNFNVQSMMYNTSDPLDITSALLEEGTTCLDIKVTTGRGNVVDNILNPLFYTAGSGWSGSGRLAILIVISKEHPGTAQFHLQVTNNEDNSTIFDDIIWMIGNVGSYIQKIFPPDTGSYRVQVAQIGVCVIKVEDIIVTTEEPVVWVYSTAI